MPHTIPAGIALDIPDLKITITPQSEYKVTIQPVDSYHSVLVQNTTTTATRNPSIFVDHASSASYVATASFALETAGTASAAVAAITASGMIMPGIAFPIGTGPDQVLSGSVILSGSTTTGIISETKVIDPSIPTSSFLGCNVDYRAFREGAARQGMLLATWLGGGSNLISFTDASSADIGDTSEISFDFVITGENVHLRMSSTDLSDNESWTVQTFFRLFPKFPT